MDLLLYKVKEVGVCKIIMDYKEAMETKEKYDNVVEELRDKNIYRIVFDSPKYKISERLRLDNDWSIKTKSTYYSFIFSHVSDIESPMILRNFKSYYIGNHSIFTKTSSIIERSSRIHIETTSNV